MSRDHSPVADRYAHVPAAPRDATEDEHWAATRLPGTLPGFYMPPAMPGVRTRSQRIAAWGVIILLLSGAGAGICFTYGPGELIELLSR